MYAWAEFSYTALSGYSLGLHPGVQNQIPTCEWALTEHLMLYPYSATQH